MLRGSRAGQLFGSCSLGLSFISSIVFTSASPSASFPAAGSLLLNHCSAQQLPGTGSMPRLDGGSKSRLQTSLCLFSFSNVLNFFFFYPPEPAGAATSLSLPPFWLQSSLGSGSMFRHLAAGSVGFGSGWHRAAPDREWEESRDHSTGQSYPPWLPGMCWWPLALAPGVLVAFHHPHSTGFACSFGQGRFWFC